MTSRSRGRRSASRRDRRARSTGRRTRCTPGVAPTAERDLVLLSGIEPNLRWRSFADAVIDGRHAARREDGGHARRAARRRARIRARCRSPASPPTRSWSSGSTCSAPATRDPTGIVGIVHDACRRNGLTSASLWAAVPHYVAAVPNPKAALALLRRLEGFTGVAIEASELEEAMSQFETQVDRAVASNPEIEELVRRLEVEQDDIPELDSEDVPSGDTIAQDFQRFLRQRSDGD